ncbi:peroxiredoxin [[Clostridium] polysaccharolyticum]|uniref:Peroxiredoxin n=1 Tax=[Clostridium] polysaccharolyticum TaxID=29364 RepID=A0A1H9ZF79_9FIRM|nr:peroxiredoxin [[Clostridium] polysaccharolyticum]SES80249.1 3-Cys thioredoxin peroxidase [[Clostridium] polysaccharolyticum]
MERKSLSIGQKAPDFTAVTTQGDLKMSDYKGKWVVFFSHPGDFTPVCSTEFLAFATMAKEFEARNAQLLGISIDSNPSHLAWVRAIFETTGVTVPFPIIADRVGDIAKAYGMIADDVSSTETVRNVFLIDPEQKIRAILIYPLTNGRNIPEILRLLTALQTTDKYNVVTPANWEPGEAVLVPAPKDYSSLLVREDNQESLGLDCADWFWCYKNINDK